MRSVLFTPPALDSPAHWQELGEKNSTWPDQAVDLPSGSVVGQELTRSSEKRTSANVSTFSTQFRAANYHSSWEVLALPPQGFRRDLMGSARFFALSSPTETSTRKSSLGVQPSASSLGERVQVDAAGLGLASRVTSFVELPLGWDGHGSMPAPRSAVLRALRLLRLQPFRDHTPQAFPTGRQSVQLEYEKEDGAYLEFEVFADRTEAFGMGPDDEITVDTVVTAADAGQLVTKFFS